MGFSALRSPVAPPARVRCSPSRGMHAQFPERTGGAGGVRQKRSPFPNWYIEAITDVALTFLLPLCLAAAGPRESGLTRGALPDHGHSHVRRRRAILLRAVAHLGRRGVSED